MSRILKCLATLGGAVALVVVLLLLSLPAAGAPRSGAGLAHMSATPPTFLFKWGGEGSGNGQFEGPRAVALDGQGTVYVTDGENNRVERFDKDGHYLGQWGSGGTGIGQFSTPNGIACSVGPDPFVYVVDTFNCRVEKFKPDGTPVAQWGTEGSGPKQFLAPGNIAVASSGNVYVGDWANSRIEEFAPDGTPLGTWPGQFGALAADGRGDLYVGVGNNPTRVEELSAAGDVLRQWSSFGSGPGSTFDAHGIAVGSDGDVYVSDDTESAPRILEFTADGKPVTQWPFHVAGDTRAPQPMGLAVAPSGDVYVVDANNQCVKKYGSVPSPVDRTPPATTVEGADNLWHNRPVTLTFTATDNPGGSGVAYTEARGEHSLSPTGWGDWRKLDPSDPAVDVLAPKNHGNDGKTVVQYRSADEAGNVEDPPKEVTVLIDTTPPKVVAVLSAEAVPGHRTVIDFKVTDRLSPKMRVQAAVFDAARKAVRVASSGWLPIKGLNGWSFPCELKPGTYTTVIKASDLAGNWSEWGKGKLTVK